MNISQSLLQASSPAPGSNGAPVPVPAASRAQGPDSVPPAAVHRSNGAPHPQALEAVFLRGLLRRRRVFAELQGLHHEICDAAGLIAQALQVGGRLLFFGNGASGCTSQHLAAEFNSRLHARGRRGRAFALSVSAATPISDAKGSISFERQLAAYARAGDCVIGLSISGETANVLRAFETARSLGLATVGLLGREGSPAQGLVDAAVVTALADPALVHEAHLFIGHTWCAQTEGVLVQGTLAPLQ